MKLGAGRVGVLAEEGEAARSGEGEAAGEREWGAEVVGEAVGWPLLPVGVAVGVVKGVGEEEREALVLLLAGAGVEVETFSPVALA